LKNAYPEANNYTSKNKKKKEKEEQKPPVYKQECSPLQVPDYKLPIDSSAMDTLKKAIDVSLNPATNQILPNSSNIDIVTPYDYDEYDAYLNISNVVTNKIDNSPLYRTTPALVDYLKSIRDNYDKLYPNQSIKLANVEHFTNFPSNKIKVDVNLYNLFYLSSLVLL